MTGNFISSQRPLLVVVEHIQALCTIAGNVTSCTQLYGVRSAAKKGGFGAPSGGSEGSSRFGGCTFTEGTVSVSCGPQSCQRNDEPVAACRS